MSVIHGSSDSSEIKRFKPLSTPKHRVDIAVTDFNSAAMFIILTLILI